MDLAYSYTAKTNNGQTVTGTVYAPNKPLAYGRLKKGGFLPLKVELSAGASLSSIFHRSFDAKELARFYKTIGRRMSKGKPLVEGLESATEYVKDARLRQAVMMMRQSVLDGQKESEAMAAAGFPRRDCLVINSTSDTGKGGETFLSLGEELARKEQLRHALSSTFRMPLIMGVFMVSFIWAALVFIAPMTLSFLKQTGLKLNFSPLLEAYFEFVAIFNATPVLSSVVYFAAFAALAWAFRTSTFKAFLDRFKTLRDLSMKSDHAALWNSYVLLYGAAVPAKEAASIVGDAAIREDSRKAFHKLGRLIEAGRTLQDGVGEAGFPDFIVSGVKSAVSGDSEEKGILEMVDSLQEDVTVLTERLQENAKLLSIVALGGGVLLVFTMTYYPMLASVMSNI